MTKHKFTKVITRFYNNTLQAYISTHLLETVTGKVRIIASENKPVSTAETLTSTIHNRSVHGEEYQ